MLLRSYGIESCFGIGIIWTNGRLSTNRQRPRISIRHEIKKPLASLDCLPILNYGAILGRCIADNLLHSA